MINPENKGINFSFLISSSNIKRLQASQHSTFTYLDVGQIGCRCAEKGAACRCGEGRGRRAGAVGKGAARRGGEGRRRRAGALRKGAGAARRERRRRGGGGEGFGRSGERSGEGVGGVGCGIRWGFRVRICFPFSFFLSNRHLGQTHFPCAE